MTKEIIEQLLDGEIPLLETELRDLTFTGFEIDLEIAKLEEQQKLIKKILIREAARRPAEHIAAGNVDGTAWVSPAAGCEAHVVFPTDTLKSQLPAQGKSTEKVQALVPERVWTSLFEPVTAWKPMADFRAKCAELLGPKVAEKVIRECTTASTPKVLFKEVA